MIYISNMKTKTVLMRIKFRILVCTTSQKNSFPRNPQNQDIHETSSELLMVDSSSSWSTSWSDEVDDDVEVSDDSDEVFRLAFLIAVLCSNDSWWLLCADDLFAWLLTVLFRIDKLFSLSRLNSEVSEPLWLSTWLLLLGPILLLLLLIVAFAPWLERVEAADFFWVWELIFEADDVLKTTKDNYIYRSKFSYDIKIKFKGFFFFIFSLLLLLLLMCKEFYEKHFFHDFYFVVVAAWKSSNKEIFKSSSELKHSLMRKWVDGVSEISYCCYILCSFLVRFEWWNFSFARSLISICCKSLYSLARQIIQEK